MGTLLIDATSVLFSKGTDNWETPDDIYSKLNQEFRFTLDAAASKENTKCDVWFGQGSEHGEDALQLSWQTSGAVWLNPPYSMCREFIAKADDERRNGCTVVCLVPSRTDTRWWHEHVWDRGFDLPYPGVELRFLQGRIKFINPLGPLLRGTSMNGSNNSAPFPSVVVIFYPRATRR